MTHIWRPYHILHFRDTNSVQCPEWNGVQEIIHSRTEDKQSWYSILVKRFSPDGSYMQIQCIVHKWSYRRVTARALNIRGVQTLATRIFLLCLITHCMMLVYLSHEVFSSHVDYPYTVYCSHLFCCTSKRVTVSLSFSSRCPVPAQKMQSHGGHWTFLVTSLRRFLITSWNKQCTH